MENKERSKVNVTYLCACCNSIISPYQRACLYNPDEKKGLITVDIPLIRLIQTLHRKGWTTVAHSAGKYSRVTSEICLPYVEFSFDVHFSQEDLARLPENWEINDVRDNALKVCDDLQYNKGLRNCTPGEIIKMIRDASRYRFTLEIADVSHSSSDFEERAKSGIFALEDWADMLSYRGV